MMRRASFLTAAVLLTACTAAPQPERVVRFCADPNNLPFSDRQEGGFENAIARIIADELNARIEYTWWPQRRGFVRNTLRAGTCDIIAGVPYAYELVLTTRPYYRSSYVFVTRTDGPVVRSLNEPRLQSLRIGVQVIGDDYINTPPVHALTRRGVIGNLRPYRVQGDYGRVLSQADVVRAVAAGEVDVAIVWGPLAGYSIARLGLPLRLAPVQPNIDIPFLPMTFDIAMGVRRGDTALRDSLDAVLARREREIRALLGKYGVPVL
ncbi:MAG: quinoprotein dehydrogenase-associated putative ABC transporter substrate-binding protein [Gemmatimonadota bacterium]